MKFLRKHLLLTRVLWTLAILVIYLLGQAIIIPGIDPAVAKAILHQQTYLQMMGITIGSQFQVPTLFSLGLGPYMIGLIVWQAITALDLDWVNRLTVNQTGYIQKIISLFLAVLQGFQMLVYISPALVPVSFMNMTIPMEFVQTGILVILIAGAMLTIFMGNMNTEKGLGGISILILPGVLLGMPRMLQAGWQTLNYKLTVPHLITAAIVSLVVIILIVMLLQIELRIPLQRPLMEGSGAASYLPFKLLLAGAMPFMFSSTLFLVPRGLLSSNVALRNNGFAQFVQAITNQQTVAGIINYAVIIMLLTYGFGFITVQPLRLSKQMKENNEYILDVFPGHATTEYLMKSFWLMATIGGLCLVVIATVPLIIGLKWPGIANYTIYIGSLAILITLIQGLWEQIRALYSKSHYRVFD
ncbi:preprotein translocase subunit SecY [Fructilactobacillus carniphilus]|uniref:Preprotein translocase subunit SecY n=1 Tax=Fructilactobacillus carniphilus TaxID=2940297 RepID=A0ABY5BU44_9LACO|nr:preprotein translocase subunit SecY [Fructilactobacillus carniphilus]USS90022.1 preprotein translocase subunit SecY [Fructilactobacillus carniphilus]